MGATGNAIDMIGKRFGRLLVKAKHTGEHKRSRELYWLCRCDCGNTVIRRGAVLRNGHTTSCGCFKQENMRNIARKHGGSGTPEYEAWKNMKARCYNPNSNKFEHYGGRGIKVCKRWRNSFENFLADMGPRPEGGTNRRRSEYSVERRDSNKDYTPDNCLWDTQQHQVENRRPITEEARANMIKARRARPWKYST